MNGAETETVAILREVFTTDAAIEEWLDSPEPQIGWLTPRIVLPRPGGAAKVRELVLRMIYGVPP